MEGPAANCTEDTPVPLPSYEEAVYGPMGAPAPPASQGLVPPVLLTQPVEAGSSSRVPGGSLEMEDPPPSYQEVMAAENALGTLPAERWLMLSAFP